MEEVIPEIIEEVTREAPFELLLVFAFVLLFSLIFRRVGQPAVMGCFVGGFVLHLLSHFTGIDFTQQLRLEPAAIFFLIGILIFNEGLSVEMDFLVKNKEEIGGLAIVGTFVGVALCGALLRALFGMEWVVAISASAIPGATVARSERNARGVSTDLDKVRFRNGNGAPGDMEGRGL
jgi:NhaP-type Na+/H+ or K+/H+ antiporter